MLFFLTYAGLCLAAPLAASASSQIVLPQPTGLFKVGMSVAELIDYSRSPPFVASPEPLRLEISVFYPVDPKDSFTSAITPYMPPATARIEDVELSAMGMAAPNGTFEKLALDLVRTSQHSKLKPNCAPLVVFMPGEGTTRLFYSQFAATIASQGYTVVVIDAPYDVDVVEYTNGSLALFNATMWDTSDYTALAVVGYTAIESRMGDVSFVLDSLSNVTFAKSLVPNLPSTGLNTTHTAMFGHSLGGTTAYSLLDVDDRILGGLGMDGGLFGPPLLNGSNKPYMFVGREGHTRANGSADLNTWKGGWQNLTGWKREIVVAGTGHYDFSDYPIVFETLGITPNTTVAVNNGLGPMEGKRALKIATTYVGAFLDFVIHGKSSSLLDGPVDEFPEVTFEF